MTSSQKQEAVIKCELDKALIKPFLEKFSREHDCGTAFYEDLTVLYGPGASTYSYFQNKRKDVFNRWQKDEVSIYNIKWAAAAFVIEYKKLNMVDGQLYLQPVRVPHAAFMVHNQREYPVSLEIANAVKDLRLNQELMRFGR